MGFGWEGEKTRLVPLDQQRHFDNCVRWLNDPEVTAWLLMGDFPLTRTAEEEFFKRSMQHDNRAADVVFAIETRAEAAAEHIGVCGLHGIDYRHGVGVAGIVLGRSQLWSRGLGSDAFTTLLRYAFTVLGLRLVLSEALAENERSVRMHRRCGLCEIGRVAGRYWKRGAYRDVVLYAAHREHWPAPPGEGSKVQP